ncbi:MAG: NAD(P)-binding protein [Betaproteobacteria bacterium]|nr:NAD(P)-binding protein [Betaproteobacteria bacterium]MBI3055037.1 NAD(P)-binding protein [Betaproteobacteria bacterium]
MTALFTPMHIGNVEIRNRVVMPAMVTRLADAEGHVTDATIAYFKARAAGGVGLITTEMASPERVGRHRAREIGIYDDRFLPGLTRLVKEIHSCGAKASIQIGHAGGHTREDICGEPPIAPSAVPHYVFDVVGKTIIPIAMTKERIAQCVLAFAAAARRAREAGFDCVELHVANGYLLSQFLCPEENRRDDEYGGSLANRARISMEILQQIKREMPGFPVVFRLSADDLFPTGLQFPEALEVAKWAAAGGADAIHVTAGHYRSLPSPQIKSPPMACAEGIFLDYAARIKAEVRVPVIAVGRLGNPAVAMAALDSGKADFVALGRSLIADPEWVEKVRLGKAVRRCLACNSCSDEMRGGDRLGCLVNPLAAHEIEFAAASTVPQGERVCVIGAGPAGLSYASLIAPGNHVTVFERENAPGGAFRYAGRVPRFQEVEANQEPLNAYIGELERECKENGVIFKYGVDASRVPGALRGFDRVVIATGARYRYGLGVLVASLLRLGWGKSAIMRRFFSSEWLRNWFYHGARQGTGDAYRKLGTPGQKVVVIGDAVRAGKGKAAIASAFRAAYGQNP